MKYSLPESANDLLIKDGKLLMRSLSVYEVLRRFGHIIRLTPFRFEDFTATLLAEEQSALLAEIHIQLLKTLLREDRQQQTWLGPPDIRDSVNIYLLLADHVTWPAALRIYLSADPKENSTILEKLGHKSNVVINHRAATDGGDDDSQVNNYPHTATLTDRLDVLEQLCDQFLLSNLAREEIVNGNQVVKHDSTCRVCSKPNGDLVPCSNCTAVCHLKCSDPPLEDYPTDEDDPYLCGLCKSNHIKGVSDCMDLDGGEQGVKTPRLEPLGVDKQCRRYWFLARRLFVVDEDEEDVRYYTNTNHLAELIENLNHEKELCSTIRAERNEIERQMKITEELYQTLMNAHKKEDGTYTQFLGQDGSHKNYINYYATSSQGSANGGKNQQHSDRDVNRSLSNKFSVNSLNSFKWSGAINGSLNNLTITIRSTILKFESILPHTFIHPCWQQQQKQSWVKMINFGLEPRDYAIALSQLETCIKPVLFKPAWYEAIGFTQLFRSTAAEREELKKTDRQPRGFERREWFSQDFELSYRLGTMVKFSSKLKPVKHQVWKQKGEEYRLTGLNAWYWRSCTHTSRLKTKPKLHKTEPFRWLSPMNSHPFIVDKINEIIKDTDVINVAEHLSMDENQRLLYPKKPILNDYKQKRISKLEGLLKLKLGGGDQVEQKPAVIIKNNGKPIMSLAGKLKLPPCHDFLTKRSKIRSILVLPDLELHKLARSGGLKEAKSFNYTAKQNNYIWPYGMTPRPTFRTAWLYRNRVINSLQDVALQLKLIFTCIRWDDVQVRPPASGHNVIVTDETNITIELLKKRDRLPYLTHSEYLIRKVMTPIEQQPAKKYRKITTPNKVTTPSARSGLRARRQVEKEEEKGPTTVEVWVPEDQLELWELKQFDERIERQNQLMRERALKEEQEKRRKLEEEKRRKAEQERRRRVEEEAKKARLAQSSNVQATSTSSPRPNITIAQPRSLPTTPVLRYFRTEQGQIIRLPASYLQRGTPLILRHVGPGPNQTNTYIIRPQITPVTTNIAVSVPSGQPSPATSTASTTTATAATTTTTTTIITTTTTTAAPSTPTTAPDVKAAQIPSAASDAPAPATSSTTDAAAVPATPTTLTTPTTAVSEAATTTTATTATATTPAPTTTITAPATTAADTPEAPKAEQARAAADAAPPPTTATTTTTTTETTTSSAPSASDTNSTTAAAAPSTATPTTTHESVGTVKSEQAHVQHAPTE